MKRILYVILLLAIIILLMQCTKNSTVPVVIEPTHQLSNLEKKVIEADNIFGIKLFKQIVNEEIDKNVFISPLSISMALGMTLNGADGTTKEAMQNTLELNGLNDDKINKSYYNIINLLTGLDPKVKMEIANSIWYRDNFIVEDAFINTNEQYFDALVKALNFNNENAKDIINNWVNTKTHGKIEGIVDRIDPQSIMFLINAIYFKGTWTYQFDESNTYDGVFTLPDNTQKSCKMMKQTNDFQYLENDKFQAIDLPYGDKKYSMVVILPKESTNIDELIAEIDSEKWNIWISQFVEKTGELSLPRFKLAYKLTLNKVLKALGMEIAFSGQADFTRINKNGGLFISEVKHKSFVEVNEEGTEAAAVTSVEIRNTSYGDDIFMNVDHPFIFVIRENDSQTLLFMGKIVDPTLN